MATELKTDLGEAANITGPEDEAWQKMPIGCENGLNKKFCTFTLIYGSTSDFSGIKAKDFCDRTYGNKQEFMSRGDRGLTARHYQCLAAANDESLVRKAQEFKKFSPKDVALYKTWAKEDLWTLAQGELAGGEDWETLSDKAFNYCEAHVSTTDSGKLGAYGFCRHATKRVQDCDFFFGIQDNWSNDYGWDFCTSKFSNPAKYRCLSLRMQLISIAKSMSKIGSGKFISFDEIFQKKKSTLKDGCEGNALNGIFVRSIHNQ